MVGRDPFAGGEGRLAGHVLARGVAGRVVEPQVQERPDCERPDGGELAGSGRRLGRRLDRLEIGLDPFAKNARLERVVEDEGGRALHGSGDDRRLRAAALG